MGQAGLLCQSVVGEWVGVGSLPVEFLLGELGVALFLVGFTVVLALLTLPCCRHGGRCWAWSGQEKRAAGCDSDRKPRSMEG